MTFNINGWTQVQRKDIIESPIITQSPNVAEMTRYTDRPVSYFNGTTQVSIPLCEVTAHDITLPISLSYSCSGFKPSQEATWVGYGWSLSLNACISRYIKCVDDFLEYNQSVSGYAPKTHGYYGSHNIGVDDYTQLLIADGCEICNGTGLCSHNVWANELVVDSEPDIFCYNLWNGGDKFVINDDDNSEIQAFFVDKANGYKLHILTMNDPVTNRELHYFELVDNNGTIYEFKKRELTYTYSSGGEANYNVILEGGYESMAHGTYASSWFLTKITTPKKKTISFLYDEEDYDAVSQETCMRYRGTSSSGQEVNAEYTRDYYNGLNRIYERNATYSWSKTRIKTARLSKIVWAYGEIRFISSPREDVYTDVTTPNYPKKLDRIEVYNSLSSLVHCYCFKYGYFDSEVARTPINDCLYKRLKLEQVSDSLTPNFTYSFAYNEELSFPSKQSKNIDYWGYYNGKNYGRQYYCQAFDPETQTLYGGAVKDSHYGSTMLGMLTSISHPTGAKESFFYELNKYEWPTLTQTGGYILDSLASIVALNQSSVKKADSLYYAAGSNVCLKIYGHLLISPSTNYGVGLPLIEIINVQTNEKKYVYMPYYANVQNTSRLEEIYERINLAQGTYKIKALRPNFNGIANWNFAVYDPNPISYSTTMTEREGAGLRIKRISCDDYTRSFNYPMGTLLVDPILYHKKKIYGRIPIYDGENVLVDYRFEDATVLIQHSESSVPLSTLAKGYDIGYEHVTERVNDVVTDYYYGRLEKEQRRSPNPYQSTSPVFSNGLLVQKTVTKDNQLASSENTSYLHYESPSFRAFDFTYVNGLIRLDNYRFKCYYPYSLNNIVDGVESSVHYSYNDDLLVSSIEKRVSSQSSVYKTEIKYTSDYSDNVSRIMKDANMLVPVEEISYTDNDVTSGKAVNYMECGTSHIFVPSQISNVLLGGSSSTGSSFYPKISYDRYDDAGNPVQVTKDGITSVYIWGYEGQYPIAEIQNMNYATLTSVISSYRLASIRNSVMPTEEHWYDIDRIRSQYPNSMMTKYTYIPLIGIESQTMPNGMKWSYNYYPSGRLESICVEHDGNSEIIQHFDYNFSGPIE